MAKIINQSNVDLSNSVLYSPSTGTPFYFFFGTIEAWRENVGILRIIPGTKTIVMTANPVSEETDIGSIAEVLNVEGMLQVNGLNAPIVGISTDRRTITLDIDSTGFSEYTAGGYVSLYVNYKDEILVSEQIRSKIIGLKRVTGDMMCHVIKRYNWETGMRFEAYDPSIDLMDKQFYCYSAGNIYLCLDNAKNMSSIIRPSGNSLRPQKYSDGYTWQYVQTVSTEDMVKFGSEEWVPVRPEDEFNIKAGSIISISVRDRGINYDHNDRIRIIGDGEGARAQIGRFLAGGQILNIDVTDNGRNYTWADAWIEPGEDSSGDGGLLAPVISPNQGKFTNPVMGLLAHNIRFVFEVDGDENGQLYAGPIRSIGMIRPQIELYKTEFSKDVIDTRSWMDVQGDGQYFQIGDTIKGLVSNTQAVCAGSNETRVWFVETQGVGFIEGEMVTSGNRRAVTSKIFNYDMSLIADSCIIYAENFIGEYMRNKDQLDRFIVTISY